MQIEHDGFTAIHQHPMFSVQSDSSGQDQHLKITALAYEVLQRIPVTDMDLSGSNRQLCVTVPEVENVQDAR